MTIEERSALASAVVEKMMYMCGCRNCITTVEQIIMNDRKPFDNQCDNCGLCDLPNRGVRKKGHWEFNDKYATVCSVCKTSPYKGLDADIWSAWEPSYCPNCGAKMKEVENKE